jgi:hypothetical protein
MAKANRGMPETVEALGGDRPGAAGDKVAGSDPAAAPLGTDAEAGGTAPTPAEVRIAAEQEIGRGGARAAGPEGESVPLPLPRLLAGAVTVAAIALVELIAP